jgi:hypothetical protein
MLLCDGKPVTKGGTGVPSKFFTDKVKEMKAQLGEFPIRFKFPDRLREKIVFVDRFRHESPDFAYPIGHRQETAKVYRSADGSQRWQYFENTRWSGKGDKAREIYLPKRLDIKPEMTFTELDIEKLFFLVYISGICEKIEGLTDQFTGGKTYMTIIDTHRQDKKYADQVRTSTKINSFLYDDEVLPEPKLRLLAKSYSIIDVDGVKPDQLDRLRNQISKIVTKAADPKAMDKFMEATKIPDIVRIKATLQDGIDYKCIARKTTNSGMGIWYWITPELTEGDQIMSFRTNDGTPMKNLFEFAESNPEFVKAVAADVESRKK